MKTLKADAKGSVKLVGEDKKPTGQVVKLPVVSVETQAPETFAEVTKLKAYPTEADGVADITAYYRIQIQNAGRAAGVASVQSGERDAAKLTEVMKKAMTAFINGERKPRVAGVGLISWDKAKAFWVSPEGKANPNRKAFDAKLAEAKKLDELESANAIQAVVKDFYKSFAPKATPAVEAPKA